MRVRVAAFATAVVLCVGLAPGVAEGATAYTGLVVPEAVPHALAIDAQGAHHVLAQKPYGVAAYLTDSSGRWSETDFPADAQDMAVGPSGDVFILASVGNLADQEPKLRMYAKTGATFTFEYVNVYGATCDQEAGLASLAMAPDESLHVAWSVGPSATICYRERTDGIWGPEREFSTGGGTITTSVDIALDGDTPHIVVGSLGTLMDIAVTDTPVISPVGAFSGIAHVLSAPGGGLEGTVADETELRYLRYTAGVWTAEHVTDGNILSAAIADGPAGPVLLFSDGRQPAGRGIVRADRTPTGWTTSILTTVVDASPMPAFDPGGNLHIAFKRSVIQGSESHWDLYVNAPDPIAPIVSSVRIRPTTGAKMGSTIPVTTSWVGYDNLSGYSTSTLWQQTNGRWATILTASSARSAKRSLAPGSTTYAFRVRGTDRAGNRSTLVVGPTVKLSRYGQSSTAVHYAGTWRTVRSRAYSGGSARYAQSTSSSVGMRFTGRGFAWVGTYGPTRGSAKIIVDGVWVATVNLYRSSTSYRRIAWSTAWETSSPHTITIKPMGTSGHARVDADAFIVVR